MLILTLINSDGSTADSVTGPVDRIQSVIARLPATVPYTDNRFPADTGCYDFTGNTLEVRLEAGKGGTAVYEHLRFFHL